MDKIEKCARGCAHARGMELCNHDDIHEVVHFDDGKVYVDMCNKDSEDNYEADSCPEYTEKDFYKYEDYYDRVCESVTTSRYNFTDAMFEGLEIAEAVEINSISDNPDYDPVKANRLAADADQMMDTEYYKNLLNRRRELSRELIAARNSYVKSADKAAIRTLEDELNKVTNTLELIRDTMNDEKNDALGKYGRMYDRKNIGTQYQIDDYDEEGNPVENPKSTGVIQLDYTTPRDQSSPIHKKLKHFFDTIKIEPDELLDAEASMKQYQAEKEAEAKKKAKELAKFNNSRNLFNANSKKFEALEDDYLNQDFEDPEEDEEN